jgi:F-type H+-transporting ATPase subunit epsilon
MATRQDASTGELVDDGKKDDKPAATNGKLTMQLKVYSPYKVYFEGQAYSISAESATGPFDILPKHHNFITLLVPCALTIRTDAEDENINISGGIMHVKADDVIVFLDV